MPPMEIDWTAEIRAAFEAASQPLDRDVLDELTEHASATYEAARADGADHAEASQQVAALVASWTADASALRPRPKRQPVVIAPPAGGGAWTGFAQDIVYGLRLLRRQPGF